MSLSEMAGCSRIVLWDGAGSSAAASGSCAKEKSWGFSVMEGVVRDWCGERLPCKRVLNA